MALRWDGRVSGKLIPREDFHEAKWLRELRELVAAHMMGT